MHGEQHPVRMADQGAHLFDYGFGLIGKAPVGQLVEEQVTPTQAGQPGGGSQGSGVRAVTSPGAASSSMASVVLPVLIAVVLVAVVGLLLWRRRRPAHATSSPTAVPPPDENEETRPIG